MATPHLIDRRTFLASVSAAIVAVFAVPAPESYLARVIREYGDDRSILYQGVTKLMHLDHVLVNRHPSAWPEVRS